MVLGERRQSFPHCLQALRITMLFQPLKRTEGVPFCLARIPLAGESRGNLAAGGSGRVQPLSDHDRWIAEQVGPGLKARGLFFVGLDVIGNYLTEINVTSPTCLREIEAESGLDIAGQLLDVVQAHVATGHSA